MAKEIEFVELTQDHIEKWSVELPDADSTKVPVYNGAVVRSAIKAGWFVEKMKAEDVGKMPPARVRDLAQAVMKKYAELMAVSPE